MIYGQHSKRTRQKNLKKSYIFTTVYCRHTIYENDVNSHTFAFIIKLYCRIFYYLAEEKQERDLVCGGGGGGRRGDTRRVLWKV